VVSDASPHIVLTSMVRAVGMLYEKPPVLKSDLMLPIEMMTFADSTFSFTSGWVKVPT
jgi:hypothetical protein